MHGGTGAEEGWRGPGGDIYLRKVGKSKRREGLLIRKEKQEKTEQEANLRERAHDLIAVKNTIVHSGG